MNFRIDLRTPVAAVRAAKQVVIIPHGNIREIDELPAEVRQTLRIVTVRSMDEVLLHALAPVTSLAAVASTHVQ